MLQRLLLIGFAGCVGTLARYGLSGIVARRFGETFPTGTLVVNVLGCFFAGTLVYLLQDRFVVNPEIRIAVLIGFLGGFTTLSSFGLQTFSLLKEGSLKICR